MTRKIRAAFKFPAIEWPLNRLLPLFYTLFNVYLGLKICQVASLSGLKNKGNKKGYRPN
jgi:hypothetical protein